MLVKFVSADHRIAPRWVEGLNLHVSGGLLSDCLSKAPLGRLVGDQWIHEGQAYSSLNFIGASRILFGLLRCPWRLSETIRVLSLEGRSLCSAGARFASYNAKRDMWRSTSRPIWWHSLQVIDASAFGEEMDTTADLHLWSLHTNPFSAEPREHSRTAGGV